VATAIDDNAADEKSDKSRCPLFIIHCTSTVCLNYPLRGLLYLSKEYEKIREERPEREIFRLSDAFENKELLNACKILGDYVTLVTKIREFTAQTGELADGIMRAIDYCIEHDCLRDFLVGARAEVESMLWAEGTVEEYMEDLEKEKDEKIRELDEKLQEKDEELQEKDTELQEQKKEIQRLRELLKAKGL
jgi:type I restriction-modification system DNA methylase subunit